MSATAPTRDAPPPVLPTFGWTHTAITAVARRLARTVFSLEVRGREHLPADRACIICANHTSHADTFALATATNAVSRRLVFLAAHDYFSRVRWRRWLLLRMICLVEFDRRGSVAAAAHNLRAMGACREDRRIVVLFPEGTRSRDGRIAKFKPGAAMFADKLGLPIIPCRIEGTHAALPKGKWFPRARPLRVTFGPPLTVPPGPPHETGAARSARYEDFMAGVQAQVMQLGAAAVSAPALVP
jgi:1-acyl-sn-glycerol-3-phosphate acyltransferase